MSTIALPVGGWAAAGRGVVGSLAEPVYRVTAAERTRARPGIRYAAKVALDVGRMYSVAFTASASGASALGPKRLTASWTLADFGSLPYGEGPYGGVIPFHAEVVDAPEAATTYTVSGRVPEGATGIAFELADDSDSTPWEAGASMDAENVTLEGGVFGAVGVVDMQPVPRVTLTLHDTAALGVAAVTVYAIEAGGPRAVRGGWEVPASSLTIVDDFTPPFNVPLVYEAALLDADGQELDRVRLDVPPIEYHGTVVQHVLDPWLSTEARLLATSEAPLTWSHDGELVRPGTSRLPTWIGAGSWPLQGIPLAFGTETAEQYADMRRVLGYGLPAGVDYLPIIVVRTSHRVHFPQPLTVLVREVRAVGLDWLAGGDATHWQVTADEVQPPSVALTRPALSWADVMATFGTWAEVQAVYPAWSGLMQDSTITGASNA